MVAGTCISRVKFEFFSVFDEATSASNWDMRVDDLAVQVPIRFRGFCICDFAFFVQGLRLTSKGPPPSGSFIILRQDKDVLEG